MWLWPRHSFAYATPAPPELVLAVLRENVQPPPKLFAEPTGLPFQGRVGTHGFKVVHAHGKAHVLPVVVGKVTPVGEGSRVQVGFRPSRLVEAFCVVISSGLLYFAAVGTGEWFAGTATRGFWSPVGAPLALLGMLMLPLNFLFAIEVRRQKPLVRALLGAV
jgi:hypothetical protein